MELFIHKSSYCSKLHQFCFQSYKISRKCQMDRESSKSSYTTHSAPNTIFNQTDNLVGLGTWRELLAERRHSTWWDHRSTWVPAWAAEPGCWPHPLPGSDPSPPAGNPDKEREKKKRKKKRKKKERKKRHRLHCWFCYFHLAGYLWYISTLQLSHVEKYGFLSTPWGSDYSNNNTCQFHHDGSPTVSTPANQFGCYVDCCHARNSLLQQLMCIPALLKKKNYYQYLIATF